jgi:hypothetical protein
MCCCSADSCCLLKCCCKLLALLVSAGFVVLIYWAVFQPHQIRATVGSATVSNLTVSNSSSAAEVSYTLAVSLSLYNPSLRTGIYYDTVDADRAPLPRRRRPRKFGTSSGFSSCGGSRGCGAR